MRTSGASVLGSLFKTWPRSRSRLAIQRTLCSTCKSLRGLSSSQRSTKSKSLPFCKEQPMTGTMSSTRKQRKTTKRRLRLQTPPRSASQPKSKCKRDTSRLSMSLWPLWPSLPGSQRASCSLIGCSESLIEPLEDNNSESMLKIYL